MTTITTTATDTTTDTATDTEKRLISKEWPLLAYRHLSRVSMKAVRQAGNAPYSEQEWRMAEQNPFWKRPSPEKERDRQNATLALQSAFEHLSLSNSWQMQEIEYSRTRLENDRANNQKNNQGYEVYEIRASALIARVDTRDVVVGDFLFPSALPNVATKQSKLFVPVPSFDGFDATIETKYHVFTKVWSTYLPEGQYKAKDLFLWKRAA